MTTTEQEAQRAEIQAARAYFDHIANPPLGEAIVAFYERSQALHAAYDTARAKSEQLQTQQP